VEARTARSGVVGRKWAFTSLLLGIRPPCKIDHHYGSKEKECGRSTRCHLARFDIFDSSFARFKRFIVFNRSQQ
jgi:hypothetical protein